MDLFALLGASLLFAKVLGGVMERFGIPSVLAELLTGILIGNLGGSLGESFSSIQASPILAGLSELGVLFLLFLVGLETNLSDLAKSGKDASRAAIIGVVAPFILGFALVYFMSGSFAETNFNHALFLGAALSATSVGITARVLSDAGELRSRSGQIILGAAVIDDVLGITVLAIVAAIVTQGSVSVGMMAGLLGRIAAFGVCVWVLRRFVLKRVIRLLKPLEVSGTITILMLSLCLIAAWAAEKAQLAGIIGAFALGLALDETYFEGYQLKAATGLEHLMKPVTDFLVPVFFMVVGMRVKLAAFTDPKTLGFAIALTICAVIGKLACGLPISKEARRTGADRILIGFGMLPRGEVGLIFAGMGLQLQVLNQSDYNAVVAMVALTTLLAPALISWRLKRLP